MIEIPFDPNIFNSGSFTLSWHGFMSFIAVGGAVYLVGRWAKKDGIPVETDPATGEKYYSRQWLAGQLSTWHKRNPSPKPSRR